MDRRGGPRIRRARLRSRREVLGTQSSWPTAPFARRRCAGRQHECSLQERAVLLEPERLGPVREYTRRRRARRRLRRVVAPVVRRRRRRRGARPLHHRGRFPGWNSRPVHGRDRPRTCATAWGLGLWISKAYYATAQEATDTAAALREHDIPCDVLTLDGRGAWEVRTRFDFRWDEARYPDPHAALARMRAFGLRICVWLYPYV